MRSPRLPLVALAALLSTALAAGRPMSAHATPPPLRPIPGATEPDRELLVPLEDLNVLLEGPTRRVLLERQEYEDLLARAKRDPELRPPRSAVLVGAEYSARLRDERAQIEGLLDVDVLAPGLHTIGLDFGGVGLRGAALDGAPAPIGRADDGRLVLFVSGVGRHRLTLEMVAPVATDSARQVLDVRVPTPAAVSFALTVPGDVEADSGPGRTGTAVAARVYDAEAGETRFDLVPQRDHPLTLVMTLNSKLKRTERLVVARSVVVAEVTEAQERLHATISLSVLHRAVDDFRFTVPDGFQMTDVSAPQLAGWTVLPGAAGAPDVLEVRLREPATGSVVISARGLRSPPRLEGWTMPLLEPLEAAGRTALLGLLVEDRLKVRGLEDRGLDQVDIGVLNAALPGPLLRRAAPAPGRAGLRAVAAFYAPKADGTGFEIRASYEKIPAEIRVRTNALLTVSRAGHEVHGGFALSPRQEKVFSFSFLAPEGWHVKSVTDENGRALAFRRIESEESTGGAAVILVPGLGGADRAGTGIAPGQSRSVYFTATRTPPGWLDAWDARTVEFPVFRVVGAARDSGAVAIRTENDLLATPDAIEGLIALDEKEMPQFGLGQVGAGLAFSFDHHPYRATMSVTRLAPRLTARTYSFFSVEPEMLSARYELEFDVTRARTKELSLLLPASTPEALSITGAGDARIEGTSYEIVEVPLAAAPAGGTAPTTMRRWTAVLDQPRNGTIKLLVEFQQPADHVARGNAPLPVVRADGVVYQSGVVSVEGSPQLDVGITGTARPIDVGELVDAQYQPGPRLLGVWEFIGDAADLKMSVARDPAYALPPAIVERARLVTALAGAGTSVTEAVFELRAKALFLEVRLPASSVLWTITLDGQPTKPQREGDRLLLDLPAGSNAGDLGALRTLSIVYETATSAPGLVGNVDLDSPRLARAARGGGPAAPIPVADLEWRLETPRGYRVLDTGGSVDTDALPAQPLAVTTLARLLVEYLGGVSGRGILSAGLGSMRSISTDAMTAPGAELEAYGDLTLDGVPPASASADRRKSPARKPPAARPAPATAAAPPAPPPTEVTDYGTVTLSVQEMDPSDELEMMAILGKAPGQGVPARQGGQAGQADFGITTRDALLGARSLAIGLDATGPGIDFRNLGADPHLVVTLGDARRLDFLAWTIGLLVLLFGLLRLGRERAAAKARYVIGVGVAATLVAVLAGRGAVAHLANAAFFAAAALVPLSLLVGAVRGVTARVTAPRDRRKTAGSPGAVTTAVLMILAVTLGAAPVSARADNETNDDDDNGPPVVVPEDVIITPYDATSPAGVLDADQLLVPYDRYVELWNLAYPDKPIGDVAPPVRYAFAAGRFAVDLPAGSGAEFIEITGGLDIEVYVDEAVAVPLPVEGAVLSRAELDGAPAKLSVLEMAPPANRAPGAPGQQGQGQGRRQQMQQTIAGPAQPLVMLHVRGKGRHRLEVSLRAPLERLGGWRIVRVRVPAAPATELALSVPEARTEVRLDGVTDRTSYETDEPGRTIRTALGADGRLGVRWRPHVSRGATDLALRAESEAVLDIQEDGLALHVRVDLEFPRSEREEFTMRIPGGYLVEKVEGVNVRGWRVAEAGEDPAAAAGSRRLSVTTLKPAVERERFTIHLRRPQRLEPAEEIVVAVPEVPDASLHGGRILLRRSPLLNVRTVAADGASRIDVDAALADAAGAPASDSPLGTRPYEAYRFTDTAFSLRLAATPVEPGLTARVQTILRVGQRERRLESRVILDVRDRPVHRVRVEIPADLELEHVSAPDLVQWSDETGGTDESPQRALVIILRTGRLGDLPVLVRGTLGAPGFTDTVPLPRLAVPAAEREDVWIAVQVDPAFDVTAEDLVGCQSALLSGVFSWLNEEQRGLARLALRGKSGAYGGRLRLTPRKTEVSCRTVSNVRVTEMTYEDTVLLEFAVRTGGVRAVSFLLPEFMADARISVPLLRRKTVVPAADRAGWVRVTLELQDEVMDRLLVLVENDRALGAEEVLVPIPLVETGATERRFAAIENAGRDEVVVAKSDGLQPLGRQQAEWREVADLLSAGLTEAFVARGGAGDPVLRFRLSRRQAVQTVGARIGLAQTMLVLDAHGAYRARQTYRVENATEQHLQVELPAGADLWSATVAGLPVKPVQVPGAAGGRQVRIPLTKTAAGDLDYVVVVKYGGAMDPPGAIRKIRFPLLRAMNINVELSQVRLLLPETKAWYGFSGTMRRVVEEGEFEAGYVSYQTRQLEQLAQSISEGNVYAQLRGATNIESLKSEIGAYQAQLGRAPDNPALRRNIESQRATLDAAEKQVDRVMAPVRSAAEEANRYRFQNKFRDQESRRSTNVVQRLDENFVQVDVDGQVSAGDVTRFDRAWFFDNSLVQGDPDGDARSEIELLERSKQAERFDVDKEQQAPAVAGKDAIRGLQSKAAILRAGEAEAERAPAGGMSGRAGRYQQVLEQQQEQMQQADDLAGAEVRSAWDPQGGVVDRDGAAAENAFRRGERQARAAGTMVGGGFSGGGGDANRFTPAGFDMAGGWTSLDFTLPERGIEYRFTTPRGDIEIGARALSRDRLRSLAQLVLVIAVVVVVLLARPFIPPLNPEIVTNPIVLVVALLAGAAMVLVGILPVLGLILAVGAIAIFAVKRLRRADPAVA